MTRTGQQKLRVTTLALGAMLVTVVIGTPAAQAQTYTVLNSFRGVIHGAYPLAGLIEGSAGNLYGTTEYGGETGDGVVFRVDTAGTETVLHSFTGQPDGAIPFAGLIRDSAGNLYGTTERGGIGYGVVFKLDTSGTETVLYSFTGGADGGSPASGVIRDSAGNLYGTTTVGGIGCHFGCGVVFKLDTAGTETVLHTFRGGDGANPATALIRDSAGDLYGTTPNGGSSNAGVVFKVNKTGETVLHSFRGGADGASPLAGLIQDSAGNLYGTTAYGGLRGCPPRNACGVVFKLDTTGTYTVLYSFTGKADGANPFAGLIQDSAGNLYGTTNGGGTSRLGVVFKLDTTGTETVLYSFTGVADGFNPFAGVIRDSAGNLYGITPFGGIASCECGVVFKLQP